MDLGETVGKILIFCNIPQQLHADGLLESLDYGSLDACEPCLMGKMTKTAFSEQWSEQQTWLEIIKRNSEDWGSDDGKESVLGNVAEN